MKDKKEITRFDISGKVSGDYVYRMSTTGSCSQRYGVCEVCNNHVSEVYLQSEGRLYINDTKELAVTYANCNTTFGHKECLLSVRR